MLSPVEPPQMQAIAVRRRQVNSGAAHRIPRRKSPCEKRVTLPTVEISRCSRETPARGRGALSVPSPSLLPEPSGPSRHGRLAVCRPRNGLCGCLRTLLCGSAHWSRFPSPRPGTARSSLSEAARGRRGEISGGLL